MGVVCRTLRSSLLDPVLFCTREIGFAPVSVERDEVSPSMRLRTIVHWAVTQERKLRTNSFFCHSDSCLSSVDDLRQDISCKDSAVQEHCRR